MKKNYLYHVILLLGVFLYSCNGYLEEMPQNKMKPTTIDDYEQLLNRGYISKQVLPYLELLSDDATLFPQNEPNGYTLGADIYMGAYMWYSSHETTMPDGDKAFESFYNSCYYANVVIDNVEQAEAGNVPVSREMEMKENLKGEACVLRAYSYFNLVNLYAKPYDPVTCDSDPGVPINIESDALKATYARSSVKDVYALIEGDLKEGIRLMEKNPIDRGTKLRFNAISARALLARVYLYMQQWDLAIEQAETVIRENSSLFDLNLAYVQDPDINNNADFGFGGWWSAGAIPGKDYLSLDNSNVLFANGLTENIPAFSKMSTQTSFGASLDLYNSFKDPGDIRQNYFLRFANEGVNLRRCFLTKNRYINYVYVSMEYAIDGTTGYSRVIRTEEMYLILAECYAHKPDGLSQAVAYLNTMRQAKFIAADFKELNVDDYTADSFIERVWLERRLELCFEGHRWFDLRRTTRPALGERTGYKNAKASLAKDDPRYVLQIPQKELSVNPEIGINPR